MQLELSWYGFWVNMVAKGGGGCGGGDTGECSVVSINTDGGDG